MKYLKTYENFNNLELSSFDDLPDLYKKGLIIYVSEGEPVEWSVDKPIEEILNNQELLNQIINDYSKVYGDKKFLFGIMSIDDIIKGIGYIDDDDEFDTFEEYHKWYQSMNKANHGDSVLPIILTSDKNLSEGYEFIEDGWHRFHYYYSKNIKSIPVVKFL